MIQRIQSLFLLGVVICMALIAVFPIWEKTNPEAGLKYTMDAFYWLEYSNSGNESGEWTLTATKQIFYLAGIGALVCLVALFSLFQFKKRVLQIKLGALNAFLMMAFIATAAYFIYQGESKIGMETRGVFNVGFFLPLGGMIFNSLANRFIKKDEDLVRSVDRIR